MMVISVLAWLSGLFFAMSTVPAMHGKDRFVWFTLYGVLTGLWVFLFNRGIIF